VKASVISDRHVRAYEAATSFLLSPAGGDPWVSLGWGMAQQEQFEGSAVRSGTKTCLRSRAGSPAGWEWGI